ncbi:MAG TPA: hypothetical protein DCF42_01835 [Lachnospiraceae bacterium]|nr:hypothetical protein [Lachnospiraceae bacterium]
MWQLYDNLVDGIPSSLIVDEFFPADHFSFLKSGTCCGVSHTMRGSSRPPEYPGSPVGRSLKDAAAGIRSWNLAEASAGMAAINAYYNSRDHVNSIGLDAFTGSDTPHQARRKHNPLDHPPKEMFGKKTAVIGHFPHIEEKLSDLCDLYILERNPRPGDYPDSASEYLLPEMDYIFATGMTLINKTLPRLLQLKSPHAKFVLVGPSGPLTPVLFEFGVDCIASYVVTDPDFVCHVLKAGKKGMFQGGKMVEYFAP